jgi:hypothetical protein
MGPVSHQTNFRTPHAAAIRRDAGRELARLRLCVDVWPDNKPGAFFVWLFQNLFHT